MNYNKYRNKSFEVEAFQVEDNLKDEVGNWHAPDWVMSAYNNGDLFYVEEERKLFAKTLDGNLSISNKDFIMKDIENNLHICKPDVFKMTYEKIE